MHFRIRLEEDRLCFLVTVGVRLDRTKELVAVADGYRESTENWARLLRDLKRRGLAAPIFATGDEAPGFWAALRDVFAETREERCRVQVTANACDALPTRLHAPAKGALVAIYTAPTMAAALDAVAAFAGTFVDHPKAVAKVTDELDALLGFYDFPVEHHIHLRTSNPIESTFSTVRLGTRVTKGAGSQATGLAMAFKLLETAQENWRKVNAPHSGALARTGAWFIDGQLQEREERRSEEPITEEDAAARPGLIHNS